MNYVTVIRATALVSDLLFRRTPTLYMALYERYKRVSERSNIALMRRLVKAGDHVADIGANVGFYASVLGDAVGPSGRVYAFEPDLTNFDLMAAGSKHLPQVECVHAAVTDKEGFVNLYLSPNLNVDHRTYKFAESKGAVPVRAVTLDGYLAEESALQFIKLDIQGAEPAALQGMEAVVARSPDLKILMELTPFLYEQFGEGTHSLVTLVESWGLEMHRVLNNGGRLGERITRDTLIPECKIPDACFDVLCARPGMLPA